MERLPPQPLLSIHNLQIHFPVGSPMPWGKPQFVRAVDGVNLVIEQGQTLGLVGESGCGKTTIGKAIVRLIAPTAGSIVFEGTDVTRAQGQSLHKYRRNIQMVFQDPYTSLNPRLSVAKIIAEPLRINKWASASKIQARTNELLQAVGLSIGDGKRYPHEFSGGQRQRIAIARALSLAPKLIVCDEPVSALDMSIQAKILNLLSDLRKEFQLTYLFISHDLSVVRLMSDWVAVMYLGKIVELSPSFSLFSNPLHPYTQALMAAVPDPHIRSGIKVLPGELPSNIQVPAGCAFHTRCAKKMPVCETHQPQLSPLAQDRLVACFLYSTANPQPN
jgi:oligopeptide/dipeptide ABC transporter ATP-binding protein